MANQQAQQSQQDLRSSLASRLGSGNTDSNQAPQVEITSTTLQSGKASSGSESSNSASQGNDLRSSLASRLGSGSTDSNQAPQVEITSTTLQSGKASSGK